MSYFLLSAGFFVPAAVVGRWWVLSLPVATWVIYAIGVDARWWGRRPGEFLVLGTLLLVAIGIAATAGGILVHRLVAGEPGRPR